jgi:hypothetical protein
MAFEELCEARPGYLKAEAFYAGDYEEVYASEKVARMLAKSGLNNLDKFNFAKLPVDAVANRLRISNVTTEDDAANAELATIRKRNELDQELPGLHRKASTCGDTYMMVWPAMDEKGNVAGVDMFHNGPQTVRVIYDAEHPLKKAFAIKSWTVGCGRDQHTRATLYYPDRIERWIYKGKWSKKNLWEPYDEDGQPSEIPNPYGEVPIFHYRNQRPYGLPEHQGAYGPQSAITKSVVSHLGTLDFNSVPQRYGLIDPAVDQSGTQSDWDPEHPHDEDDDPEDTLNTSQLRNDPGEMWLLQGMKGVGQFDAAQPDVYLKPFDRYIKAMAQLTETPMHIFDSTGDAVSGKSRREANAPLTAKAKDRQDSYGSTHEAAFTFALRILGYDDVTVTVQWEPAEVVSDAEGWQTVKAKIDSGVPRETALVEAGYAPETVRGWMATIDDDSELMRRIAILERLGAAVQALGAGVQLEAITSDQVTLLLDRVLTATTTLGEDEAAA